MSESPPLDKIGKFQITDLVGEGAMGVVYRGYDPILNRYVAIKLMGAGVSRDEQLRTRFLREARAAGSLQHPSIVTIYDCGEASGHLFIAMEYIEGTDLADLITHRDPIPLHAKLDIMIDVLNGLQFAHDKGIVHRDIKPANIRVSQHGRAKVMDFGIAHLHASDMTKTGMLIGTPDYMAPEQIDGQDVTPRTDVFSVGTVLYELITYERPFEGSTLHNVLYKVMNEDPVPIASLTQNIPEGLQVAVAKALAKDPAVRFQSADEMSNALARVRGQITGAGEAETIVVRKTPLTNIRPADLPETRGRKNAKKILLAGSAVGVVAVGVAVALLLGPLADRGREPAAGVAVAAAEVADSEAFEEKSIAVPARPEPEKAPGTPARPADEAAQVAQRPPRTPPAAGRRETQNPTAPNDSVISSIKGSSLDARQRAVQAGASTSALLVGDSLHSAADSLARAGHISQAVVLFSRASTAFADAEQDALRPPVTALERDTEAEPSREVEPPDTAPEPATDPRIEIVNLIRIYAEAIESRDIQRLRNAYPGMTGEQERGWTEFLDAVENIRVDLSTDEITISSNGDTATASVMGTYFYRNTSTNRTHRQHVTFFAQFVIRSGAWKLMSLK